MANLHFSLGRNTYDNQPAQCSATDFDDFVSQISQTGSTRKGQTYICSPLRKGPHTDRNKYPEDAHWRIRALALPRAFLALDADRFATPESFTEFRQVISQWNSLIYTTASHTQQAPRARALIELSREIDYDEGVALGDAVQRLIEALLGGDNITLDSCVYRSTQPIFAPLVTAELFRSKGPALDVASILSSCTAPTPSLFGPNMEGMGAHFPVAPQDAATQSLIEEPETEANIEKVKRALAKISADCPYPTWVSILFSIRSTGWRCSEAIARDWSMTAEHRYDREVFDRVWSRAKQYGGIGIGTLYHIAKQQAVDSPPSSEISLPPVALTCAGKLSIPEVPPPPRDYILGNFLVAGTVGIMASVGGGAKTTAVIQLSIQGALGDSLGSLQIGHFASALFLAEETNEERDRRFGALCSKLSAVERAEAEKLIYCEAAAGQDFRLTRMEDGNINVTPLVERIITTVIAHQRECGTRVGLIVVDHARLVMAGDPIASDHVTALLRALTKIATSTGAAILLLAHSPKSTYNKDGEADPSEVFGSGAFVDHTRTALVLHTMRESEAKKYGLTADERKEFVCMQVVKSNYGPTGGLWWFRKNVIPHWHTIELVPAILLPKGQAANQSTLSRKIIDVVKANPGRLSSRVLRDRYSGTTGKLGASENKVREALQRQLMEGHLILRAPTKDERDKYRLSANVREVLDLPTTRG